MRTVERKAKKAIARGTQKHQSKRAWLDAIEEGRGKDPIIDRVLMIAEAFQKLQAWKVLEKLPHRRETVADIAKFISNVRNEKLDIAQMSSVTAVLTGLEQEAADYDRARGIVPPYAVTRITEGVDVMHEGYIPAQKIVEVANEGKQFIKDFAKEANEEIVNTATEIPSWIYIVGGGVLGLFALAQVATISNAAATTAKIAR